MKALTFKRYGKSPDIGFSERPRPTLQGDEIEKSIGILKPGGKIVSLVGPLDAAFAGARGLNFVLKLVFGLTRCFP